MTSRVRSLLLLSALLAVACDDDSNGAAEAVASKLRSCGLVAQGKVLPYAGESELSACLATCRAEATCQELDALYCDQNKSARLYDCEVDCLAPQDCADGRGSYRWSERCDGEQDCDDGSDEQNCRDPQGPEYCASSGARIFESQRCDGHDDCGDNTDEENCPTPPPVFRCEERRGSLIQEIPITQVCDFERDCLDGSDEAEARGCATLTCN